MLARRGAAARVAHTEVVKQRAANQEVEYGGRRRYVTAAIYMLRTQRYGIKILRFKAPRTRRQPHTQARCRSASMRHTYRIARIEHIRRARRIHNPPNHPGGACATQRCAFYSRRHKASRQRKRQEKAASGAGNERPVNGEAVVGRFACALNTAQCLP